MIIEGRGSNSVGASVKDWNNNTISIGFIGEFIDSAPSGAALNTARKFLQYLAFEGTCFSIPFSQKATNLRKVFIWSFGKRYSPNVL